MSRCVCFPHVLYLLNNLYFFLQLCLINGVIQCRFSLVLFILVCMYLLALELSLYLNIVQLSTTEIVGNILISKIICQILWFLVDVGPVNIFWDVDLTECFRIRILAYGLSPHQGYGDHMIVLWWWCNFFTRLGLVMQWMFCTLSYQVGSLFIWERWRSERISNNRSCSAFSTQPGNMVVLSQTM